MGVKTAEDRSSYHFLVGLEFDMLFGVLTHELFAEAKIDEVQSSFGLFHLAIFDHEVAWFNVAVDVA